MWRGVCVTAATDVSFVLCVVVRSLLPGSPLDLLSEVRPLTGKVNAVTAIESRNVGLHGMCFACHIEAPFLQGVMQATCLKGRM
ncbi:hypothetical protein BKA82DRAFT_998719 [Pisolithus tinctorius]|uniref:Secreted protein n=1 Tax=Pisolithus tinctorius Marx 270 TaxID=870435 RepID=A0A0C3PFA4_PISTI|nr:hypothetical protein BKA82DRAFT_998719 [Pisolithus tinctorius]KIO06594.1 hypothetical protein M404DRAFT_998719 [Pisolithus tinctorius Marx 270]